MDDGMCEGGMRMLVEVHRGGRQQEVGMLQAADWDWKGCTRHSTCCRMDLWIQGGC